MALPTSYQRVTTATDYDTSVCKPYLALDGTDDSFGTNSINFTGGDAMSVFAGVTKLSDAAQGVIAELSATIASNNGAFLLTAPNSAAANYNFSSKGTAQADATTSATYAAPTTDVLTGQADISSDTLTLRIDGASAASSTTDQGTGNYGNYPLFIGRRNNASLPFNGRLYSLIVAGKTVSASELASTEAYVAAKTGVTL